LCSPLAAICCFSIRLVGRLFCCVCYVFSGALSAATVCNSKVPHWFAPWAGSLVASSCIGIETRGEFIHATSTPRMRSNAMWAIRSNIGDQWCKALQYSRAGKCSIRNKVCGQLYRCGCKGPKRVLLCRALLGETYYVSPVFAVSNLNLT
jgi:hypothetical protein